MVNQSEHFLGGRSLQRPLPAEGGMGLAPSPPPAVAKGSLDQEISVALVKRHYESEVDRFESYRDYSRYGDSLNIPI